MNHTLIFSLNDTFQLSDRTTSTNYIQYTRFRESNFLFHRDVPHSRISWGGWELFSFLILSESQDPLICLCYAILCLIMNCWLKFPSSCVACITTLKRTHRQECRSWHFNIDSQLQQGDKGLWPQESMEIHQGERVMNESDKYCDVEC